MILLMVNFQTKTTLYCFVFRSINKQIKQKTKKLTSIQWQKISCPFLLTIESDADFTKRLKNGEIDRLRLCSEPPESLKIAAAEAGCQLLIFKVVANGRIELLNYLREVSLSFDYHRYGYLGARESEKRKPIF